MRITFMTFEMGCWGSLGGWSRDGGMDWVVNWCYKSSERFGSFSSFLSWGFNLHWCLFAT